MIRFNCPRCGANLTRGDHAAGHLSNCNQCHEMVTVPAGQEAPQAPTPPPGDEREEVLAEWLLPD